MKSLYVLVVDKTWARLYRSELPAGALHLVYHQALFGAHTMDAGGDEELARSLCRLLRADRQAGKMGRLVMLASAGMLGALERQYDGDRNELTLGRLEDLPSPYTDADLGARVRHILARAAKPAVH